MCQYRRDHRRAYGNFERKEHDSRKGPKTSYCLEPFAADGFFNTVAWENTSGVLLKWFASEFVREKGTDLKQVFSWLNGHMEPGPTGILVLPHFSGAATPHMDEHSRGAVLGLSLDTRRADLYKAMMEGINYELALIMDALLEAGIEVGQIISTGGSLSPQLADKSGYPWSEHPYGP